jgi:hypothetical protein
VLVRKVQGYRVPELLVRGVVVLDAREEEERREEERENFAYASRPRV